MQKQSVLSVLRLLKGVLAGRVLNQGSATADDSGLRSAALRLVLSHVPHFLGNKHDLAALVSVTRSNESHSRWQLWLLISARIIDGSHHHRVVVHSRHRLILECDIGIEKHLVLLLLLLLLLLYALRLH